MIICLGPVCVPVWHLGVFIALLIRPLYDVICRFCGRRGKKNVEEENEEPQNLHASTGVASTVAGGQIRQEVERRRQGVAPVKTFDDLLNMQRSAEALQCCIFLCYGASWCRPCRQIAPTFHRLSETYSGVFCKADVDECGELAAEVTSLPTFVVYKKANGGWYIADRVGINTQCVVQNKQLFI